MASYRSGMWQKQLEKARAIRMNNGISRKPKDHVYETNQTFAAKRSHRMWRVSRLMVDRHKHWHRRPVVHTEPSEKWMQAVWYKPAGLHGYHDKSHLCANRQLYLKGLIYLGVQGRVMLETYSQKKVCNRLWFLRNLKNSGYGDLPCRSFSWWEYNPVQTL